jgi:hypothetical protein
LKQQEKKNHSSFLTDEKKLPLGAYVDCSLYSHCDAYCCTWPASFTLYTHISECRRRALVDKGGTVDAGEKRVCAPSFQLARTFNPAAMNFVLWN